jgi:hypothetical protein
VRRASGVEEGAGLLKLEPGRREYFQAGVLPHRFYVTIPPPPSPGALPDRLHLLVQRGKLRLVERDVALGERVELEGISLELGKQAAPWARIDLRRAAPAWARAVPLALAAALAAFTAFTAAAARRRRS